MNHSFFNERKDQSEVKARIVTKYFLTWASIIAPKSRTDRIAYIDLFAGPGRYSDGSASTPIMVIEKAIADEKLRNTLLSYFNDESPDHCKSLQAEFAKLPGIETLKHKPEVSNGAIGDGTAEWLNSVKSIPTFSFIDPWGYKGLSLKLVQAAIKYWGSESVFFFNYNRINAGINNDKVEKHIAALFGEKRAEQLRKTVEGRKPDDREALILENLAQALKEYGAEYVLPFRFRNARGTRSTHHLIFVSKHVLGYKKMKDIMAAESSTHDQGVASLEYSPAAADTPLLLSLNRPLEKLIEELPKVFSGQTLSTLDIYEKHQLDTPYVLRNYKTALMTLHDNGKIIVHGHRRKGTFAEHLRVTFP
jgi:three-Cys-motif partner protein